MLMTTTPIVDDHEVVMVVVEDGNEGLNEEQRDYRSNWKYSMI